MNLIERATVIHYHRHRIGRFGIDRVEALGWRDETISGYLPDDVTFVLRAPIA